MARPGVGLNANALHANDVSVPMTSEWVLDLDELIQYVKDQLLNHPNGLEEYTVIKSAENAGYFSGLPKASFKLLLFQKHFLIRHCVYRVQQQDPYAYWHIDLLKVIYRPSNTVNANASSSSQLSCDAYLQNYYLNLNNLREATAESVDVLLKEFWQGYEAWTKSDWALTALGLNSPTTWREIQKAYRKQAQQLHPDKGGDAKQFSTIKRAYEALSEIYKKRG